MDLKRIVVASGNAHKIEEISRIFEDVEIIPMKALGFGEDIVEDGETFADNAYIKASTVSKKLNVCALADDSGLCVDALDGAPGVYSARYSGGGDKQNRALLLKNLGQAENRAAHFHCSVCLCFPDGHYVTGNGDTYGRILHDERGNNGFGYDSLFLSDDLGITFAEASPEQKNSVSHRFRALRDLRSKL